MLAKTKKKAKSPKKKKSPKASAKKAAPAPAPAKKKSPRGSAKKKAAPAAAPMDVDQAPEPRPPEPRVLGRPVLLEGARDDQLLVVQRVGGVSDIGHSLGHSLCLEGRLNLSTF